MYLIRYLLKSVKTVMGIYTEYIACGFWFLLLLYCMMFSTALLLVSAFVLCFSFTFFNDMFIIPIIMFLPC